MLKRLLTVLVFCCLLFTGCKQTETPPVVEKKLNPTFENIPETNADLASVVIMDDVALFSFSMPDLYDAYTVLISYDLSTDSVLGELTYKNDHICVFPHEDQTFAVISHRNRNLGIYDLTCQELSITPELGNGSGIEVIAYQPNHLVYRNISDSTIELYNLITKETHGTALTTSEYYTFVGTNDEEFLLFSGRRELFSLNKNGHSEFLHSAYAAQVATEDYAVGSYYDFNVFYSLHTEEKFMLPLIETEENFCAAENHSVLSTTYDDIVYYDLEQHLSLEFPVDGRVYGADLEDSYIIAISGKDDGSALNFHFFDLSEYEGKSFEFQTYDDYLLKGIEPLPEPKGSAQTVSLIQELEETYGIRVIYEDYYFTFYEDSYTYHLVDEETAYERLTELKEVLDFFPKGIFFEMNEQFPVVLFLCQEITPSAGGVNTLIDGYNVSFVDATYENSAFLCFVAHEFAHAMEHRIDWSSLLAWTDLMPEEVLAAYGDDSLVIDFTPYDDGNTPAWFVSAYGRTNAQEDRATVFEAMFNSYSNGDMYLLNPEGIQLKMKCWSQMLQETYHCCQNVSFTWDSLIK